MSLCAACGRLIHKARKGLLYCSKGCQMAAPRIKDMKQQIDERDDKILFLRENLVHWKAEAMEWKGKFLELSSSKEPKENIIADLERQYAVHEELLEAVIPHINETGKGIVLKNGYLQGNKLSTPIRNMLTIKVEKG